MVSANYGRTDSLNSESERAEPVVGFTFLARLLAQLNQWAFPHKTKQETPKQKKENVE